MQKDEARQLISERFQTDFGATPAFGHGHYRDCAGRAALGFTRARDLPLFVEQYLDVKVEQLASQLFGRRIERSAIVEIGNLAANSAHALVELWSATANDLGGSSEIAVATLTAPLRGMFARIGLPFVIAAPARPERLGAGAQQWGSYYAQDPQVCFGEIAAGQQALSVWRGHRGKEQAA